VFQAEIGAVCERADFLRFNAKFMEDIYKNQPVSGNGVMNRMEYRPLEGFVFALTPFNFTAIAGNLSTSPALMGNTLVWKPSAYVRLMCFFVLTMPSIKIFFCHQCIDRV
jgi:1-pyrroline-5-carboxylate dehydrogenase